MRTLMKTKFHNNRQFKVHLTSSNLQAMISNSPSYFNPTLVFCKGKTMKRGSKVVQSFTKAHQPRHLHLNHHRALVNHKESSRFHYLFKSLSYLLIKNQIKNNLKIKTQYLNSLTLIKDSYLVRLAAI